MNPNFDYGTLAKSCFLNGFGLVLLLSPMPSFYFSEITAPTGLPVSAYFAQAENYIGFAISTDEECKKLVDKGMERENSQPELNFQ